MIKGIFFLTFMIFGAFATVVLMIPSLSLLLLHSKRIISWRRRYNSFLCGIYLDFAGTLMSIFGTKVFVYSETPEIFQDKGILITSNHRTRIDWMFVGWCYGVLSGLNGEMRVILKDSLRSVPIFGWATQMLIYIFLSRKRENDIPHIRRALAYLIYSNALEPLSAEVVASGASNSKVSEAVLLGGANFMNDNSPPDGLTTNKTDRHSSHHSNNPSADVGSGATASSQVSSSAPTAAAVMMQLRKPTVIIFPEGTDLSERNKQRSNAYAREKGLPEMDYVLYPKPGGFVSSLSVMRGVGIGDNNTVPLSLPFPTPRTILAVDSTGTSPTVSASVSHDAASSSVTVTGVMSSDATDGKGKTAVSRTFTSGTSFTKMKGNQEITVVNPVQVVHDMTIAYRDYRPGKRSSEKSLLLGEFPKEVHICVDRLVGDDLPADKLGLEKWLRVSFYRKEAMLKKFYEELAVSVPEGPISAPYETSSGKEKNREEVHGGEKETETKENEKDRLSAEKSGYTVIDANGIDTTTGDDENIQQEGMNTETDVSLPNMPTQIAATVTSFFASPYTMLFGSVAASPTRKSTKSGGDAFPQQSQDPSPSPPPPSIPSTDAVAWPPLVCTMEASNMCVRSQRALAWIFLWTTLVGSFLALFSWFRWAVVIMIMICVAARAGQGLDSIELALHGDMILEDAGINIQIPSPPSLSPSGSFSNSGALGVDLNSDPGFGNSDPSGSLVDVGSVVGEKVVGLQHRTGAGASGARTIVLSPSVTISTDDANNTTTTINSGSGGSVTEAKKTV